MRVAIATKADIADLRSDMGSLQTDVASDVIEAACAASSSTSTCRRSTRIEGAFGGPAAATARPWLGRRWELP